MKKFGLRFSFSLGAIVGILGLMIGVYAIHEKNYPLLCFSVMVVGFYSASSSMYKFSVVDFVSLEFKERGLSYFLIGGIVGGVLGPNLIYFTAELFPKKFMASYFFLGLNACLTFIILQYIHFPKSIKDIKNKEIGLEEENKKKIALEKRKEVSKRNFFLKHFPFIQACLSAVLSFGLMNMLMAATPLAMQHHHTLGKTMFVLELHIVAMFLPSLFTGNLIKKYGCKNIILCGLFLICFCNFISLLWGENFSSFTLSLICLGVGWNFMYVGATNQLLQISTPENKNTYQGLNDMFVFSILTLSSFTSGVFFQMGGWFFLNVFSLIIGLLYLLFIFIFSKFESKRNTF